MHKHNRLNKKNAGLLGTMFGSLLLGLPAIPLAASAAPGVLNPCPKIYYEEPYDSTRLVPEGCPANTATRLMREGAIPGQQSADLPGRDLTPRRIVGADAPTTPGRVVPTPGSPGVGVVGGVPSSQPLPGRDITENREELPGRDLTPNRIVGADAPTTPGRVVPTPGSPGVGVVGETPGMTNPPGTATTLPVKPPLPENRSQAIANVMPMNGMVDVRLKNNTNAVVAYEAIGYTQRRALKAGQETVLRLPTPVTITAVRVDEGLLKFTPVTTNAKGLLELSLDEEKTLDSNQGALRIQKDGQVFLN